ncbi:hypothetical protein TWF970_010773 [Orbilia oligospora]|uniref:Uncharacterized protein n=1 Tax=Orbilia oligospora TaxID=2813651 RepID=A0A7C8R485_ORBOL|nr:hypothetical protein TWF970_010773 [Orbilia oligospora]
MSCEDAKATASFASGYQPTPPTSSWELKIPSEIRVKVWRIYLDAYFNTSGFCKTNFNLNHNQEGYRPLSEYWKISKTTSSDILFCLNLPLKNTPAQSFQSVLGYIRALSQIPNGKFIPYIPGILDIDSLTSYRGPISFFEILKEIKVTGVLGMPAMRRLFEISQSHQLKSFNIHGPAIGHADNTESSCDFCSICILEMLGKHSPGIESIRIRTTGDPYSQYMGYCKADLTIMKSVKLQSLEMTFVPRLFNRGSDLLYILKAPHLREATFYKDGLKFSDTNVSS